VDEVEDEALSILFFLPPSSSSTQALSRATTSSVDLDVLPLPQLPRSTISHSHASSFQLFASIVLGLAHRTKFPTRSDFVSRSRDVPRLQPERYRSR
jgi:hypothetical protein